MSSTEPSVRDAAPTFARKLGLFDATMIVLSGIIGSGIFINPYLVAQRVETPFLILAVWLAGGTYLFALPGSPGACRDAWDGILAAQLDYRHMPCNFVEIMPRLEEHRRRK